MPNHVETKLIVTGNKAQLKEFKAQHIIEKTDEKGVKEVDFDFNTIILCPQDLRDAISPDRTEEDVTRARVATYYKTEADRQKDIEEVKAHIELAKRNKKKYGYGNWYDFCVARWGTKWGAYDTKIVESTPSKLVLKYSTAWSPARPIFAQLSRMYPCLTFDNACMDEGWNFAVRYVIKGDRYTEEFATDEASMAKLCNKYLGYNYRKCKKCGRYNNKGEGCWNCVADK